MNHPFHFEKVSSAEAMEEALQIRFDVFVKEQGVSPDVEADEYDEIDPHWLVRDEDGNAIATARLTDKGNAIGKVERVAVIETHRKQGVGEFLVSQIEFVAKQEGFKKLILHAQTHSQGFYERLGYAIINPTVFEEDGIPHVAMQKSIHLN